MRAAQCFIFNPHATAHWHRYIKCGYCVVRPRKACLISPEAQEVLGVNTDGDRQAVK
jgi:hypothetical protein